MKNSRVIVPHSRKCFMRDQPNPWSGLIDGHYWGNYAANRGDVQGKNYVWHRVTCNDPNCPAIKAVNADVLVNA